MYRTKPINKAMKTILLLLIPMLSFGQLTDKDYHVYAGIGISITSAIVAKKYIKNPIAASLVGVVTGSVVGYAKERFYDKEMGRGVYDINDFYCTSWGSLVGGFTMVIAFDINKNRKIRNSREYYE